MPRVPRKNVSPVIADVRAPKSVSAVKAVQAAANVAPRSASAPTPMPAPISVPVQTEPLPTAFATTEEAPFFKNQRPPDFTPTSSHYSVKFIALAAIVILVGSALVFTALRNKFEHAASPSSGVSFSAYWNEALSMFHQSSQAVKNIQEVSTLALSAVNEGTALAQNSLSLALSNQGAQIISSLQQLDTTLGTIQTQEKTIATVAKNTPTLSGNLSLADISQVASVKSFLDYVIPWLQAPTPRHFIILFENTNEMRPTGGFLGSYAEVTMQGANITNVTVHDINDANAASAGQNIIPPVPLQTILKRWDVADANWFFNFPDSAAEVLKMMHSTDDGVIAITPQVVQDILTQTGPIQLNSKLSIDQSNFLTEIQTQVEAAQAANSAQPKQILQELVPKILALVQTLNASQKAALLQSFQNWIAQKDLMAYFTNPQLQSFVAQTGASGSVFDLPSSFNGNYLAVVDSNIGGGKSDAVSTRQIALHVIISSDGSVDNDLIATRAQKSGGAAWAEVPSQVYTQVFTTPGAQLTAFQGGEMRRITPLINYQTAGYVADPLVAAIDNSAAPDLIYPSVSELTEAGKSVFAFWTQTKPGTSEKVELHYATHLLQTPAAGQVYQFIYDKQAGLSAAYDFTITAPPGFHWQENNASSYDYAAQNTTLPGELILNLTLEKS